VIQDLQLVLEEVLGSALLAAKSLLEFSVILQKSNAFRLPAIGNE